MQTLRPGLVITMVPATRSRRCAASPGAYPAPPVGAPCGQPYLGLSRAPPPRTNAHTRGHTQDAHGQTRGHTQGTTSHSNPRGPVGSGP